jgi:hypothetical protein
MDRISRLFCVVAGVAAMAMVAVSASAGVDDSAPIGAWFFDEGQGTVVTDAVGTADGVFDGDVSWTDGVNGSAIAFGANEELGFILFNADEDPAGQFILHQPGNVTIAMWINTPALRHGSWFWTRGDGTDNGRFNIHNGSGDQFNFDYREDADKSPDPPHGGVEPAILDVDTWTHVAVTRSGNQYMVWKNGVPGPVWVDENPELPSANAWMLGGPRGCCPLIATLDEIGVWARALNEADINAAMDGLAGVITAVEPGGKLATSWGSIKGN